MWTRKKFILTVGGAVVGIAVIIYIIVALATRDAAPETQPGTPGDTSASGAQDLSAVAQPGAVVPPAATPEEEEQIIAGRIATAFVTRFGTYSSQGDNRNIDDVAPFSTARAIRDFEQFRSTPAPDALYAGVDTRVTSVTLEEWAPGKRAVFVAHTYRKETKADGTFTSYTQDSKVTMVFTNETWLIDAFAWVPRT